MICSRHRVNPSPCHTARRPLKQGRCLARKRTEGLDVDASSQAAQLPQPTRAQQEAGTHEIGAYHQLGFHIPVTHRLLAGSEDAAATARHQIRITAWPISDCSGIFGLKSRFEAHGDFPGLGT